MTEAFLHQQVCDYLRLQYPKVFFRTDYAAGLKLTPGVAGKHKRLQSGRAWPDIQIVEARYGYHGGFIELKREGVRICFGEECSLVSHEHIHEQAAVLRELEERGYLARFAVGFDQARELIDDYLSAKPPARQSPTR